MTPEFIAKIIGEDEERAYFFGSLADALRAFLQGEISKLIIKGNEVSIEFSRTRIRVFQTKEPIEEFFIRAPKVLLKYCQDLGEPPESSLAETFAAFFKKETTSFQIYEQVCHNPESEILRVYTNYMINFDWSGKAPQNILFHIHNVDVKDNRYWGREFILQKTEGEHALSLAINSSLGPPHTLVASLSKN